MDDAQIAESLRRAGALQLEVVLDLIEVFALALDRRGTLPRGELTALLVEALPTLAARDRVVSVAAFERILRNLTPTPAKPQPRWVPEVVYGGKAGAENGAEIGPGITPN